MRYQAVRLFFVVLVAVLLLALALGSALAGGVVSDCTEQALLSALAGGGTVTFATNCNITLTSAITISQASTTIDANSNAVVISGGNAVSLFNVSTNLTLVGLTLANGRSTNSAAGCVYVHSSATVKATSCAFLGNSVQGINGFNGSNGSTNSFGTGGNGVGGSLGTSAFGGAIYNLGTLSLINCTFLTNTATGGNGGNGGNGGPSGGTLGQGGNGGNGANGATAFGGAIYNLNNATLVSCTFSNNSALGGNGGVGGTHGSAAFPGMDGSGGAGAAGSGGGVYNARNITVRACTFAGNTAESGISAPGGNQSSGVGTTGAAGPDSFGGGLYNTWWAVVTNSTFFANTATGGVGGNGGSGTGSLPQGGNGGNGGNGIGGGLANNATITVVNCTFSNNGGVGGTNGVAGSGSFAGSNGQMGKSLGGDLAAVSGSLTLFNTILNASTSGANAYGSFTDRGYNLSSDSVSSFTISTLRNINPQLGPLSDNGGPTFTMPLLSGSPAIDVIPPSLAPSLDQRGVPRPQGPKSDIGAFEYAASTLPSITQQPADQTVTQYQLAVFSVTAGGITPLSYQWSFNGTGIPGATSRTYTISSADSTNAGAYTVVVSNSEGFTSSRSAVLTVLLPVSGSVSQGTNGLSGVTLAIFNATNNTAAVTGSNGLFSAFLPAGTYTVEPSLANYVFQPQSVSITIPPGTNGLDFAASPAFTITRLTNGLVQLSTFGNSGQTYQIQTSTNLVIWQDLATNAAPVHFTDGTSNGPVRFYRLKLPN